MSTIRFLGILCFSAALYAQLPRIDPGRMGPRDEFGDPASGSAPLVPDWPERPAAEPIAGVVSLRELQHPVSEKAFLAAFDAQQLSRAGNIPRAIAKLEKAIRINPAYRDAHWNLGVQYARVGRMADALVEFQKALEIGPPAAPIFANLALTLAAMDEFRDAEAFARKALKLDSHNLAAHRILQDSPR